MTVTTDPTRNGPGGSIVSVTGGTIDGATLGATTPATAKVTSLDASLDINMSGSGKAFKGDFSGAANVRINFQTNVANGNTQIGAIPLGTGNTSGWIAFNATDPLNAAYLTMRCSNTAASLISSFNGSGTPLPLQLTTGAVGLTQTVAGLVQIGKGIAITASATVNNGATATYTYPADTSYVYLTTSAASLTVTLPAAASTIDGLVIILTPSAAVATVAWASSGAAFIGAPAAFVANTAVRMKYTHADLKWYPA